MIRDIKLKFIIIFILIYIYIEIFYEFYWYQILSSSYFYNNHFFLKYSIIKDEILNDYLKLEQLFINLLINCSIHVIYI